MKNDCASNILSEKDFFKKVRQEAREQTSPERNLLIVRILLLYHQGEPPNAQPRRRARDEQKPLEKV